MTHKDIIDCFDSVKTTEIQKQKMLNTILANKKGAVLPVKRKTRFAFASIAAAAAVLIISTTTVLAVTFNWHGALLSYFNPTPEQVEALDGTVATPNVTITHSGLTVSVIQTIADHFGVYILYEVIAQDEAFVFPEEIIYIPASLFRSSDSDDGFVHGNGPPIILENSGNRLMVFQYFFSSTPTAAERVELYISGLYYPTEEWDYDGRKVETLFQGSWSLKWDLDFTHTGITLLPNETVTVAGVSSTITQIVITPLSVVISFEGDWLRLTHPDLSFVSIHKHNGATIIFGTDSENAMFFTVAGEEYRLPGMLPDGTEGKVDQTFFYNFDTIIDVSDIKSITIGDVTIPIG